MTRMPKRALGCTVVAGLLALLIGPANGHSFWLEPSAWTPVAGKTILLELRVGDDFKGERLPREPDFVDRFFYRSGAKKLEVKALPGRTLPAGWMRPAEPGVHEVGYESKPRFLELEAAKFEAYLREEGLERALQCRQENGESSAPGREEFVRCAKTMFSVDGPEEFSEKEALGLTLEFLAESCPDDPKEPFRVRLVREGKPVRGAQVTCLPKCEGPRTQKHMRPQVKRTDHDGRVSFKLAAGETWLVTAIEIDRLDPRGKGADSKSPDWRSYWASLTFQTAPLN